MNKYLSAYFITSLLALAFAASGCLPQKASAIGQITEPIVLKDVIRGQEITETLTFVNSETTEQKFEINSKGDISNWTKFYRIDDPQKEITEIAVPSNGSASALVKFVIPADLPNGDYTGEINILSGAGDAGKDQNNISIRQEITREVSISVSDKEIVNVEATVTPASYEVKKGDPLQIKVFYDNKGNVTVKPDVQIKISGSGGQIFNAIFPYPDNESAVKALAQKTMPPIEWPTNGQEEGTYSAQAKITLGGKTIKEDSFRFNIVKAGAPALLASGAVAGIPAGFLWTGASVILLIAIFGAIMAAKKIAAKKNSPAAAEIE